jgi:signal transduction histidine kinase/ActR/RegA family two-component response regulator
LFPGLRPDGSELPLECSVSTRRLADSLMRIVILNDVSERLAAEAEREELTSRLTQSLRMEAVGRLVSGVAHELNNPLTAILTFSEDLLREPSPELPTEPLVVIRDQARRARAIVRDLLAFVRRREERREHIAPVELVERVTNAMRREIERVGLRLELDVGPELPAIIGDAVGLEQVLTNLLDNAMRAAGKGGWVGLRAETVREGLQIVVEDSGEGIRPELLPRIFEPFFTTRAAGQGTGLGLSVSLGIVEQHGGRLTAENRAGPEHGACFTALLPFGVAATDRRLSPRVPPFEAQDPLKSLPTVEPGRTPRVLIIDDEAPVRAAMRRFFERRGWTVEEAEDGQPGLTAVLAAPDDKLYDLVISDLKMPGMSGMDVHDGLAASKPALLRRLVIATGDTASPDAAAFLSKTRCAILEKPFALDELARIVDRVMSPQS